MFCLNFSTFFTLVYSGREEFNVHSLRCLIFVSLWGVYPESLRLFRMAGESWFFRVGGGVGGCKPHLAQGGPLENLCDDLTQSWAATTQQSIWWKIWGLVWGQFPELPCWLGGDWAVKIQLVTSSETTSEKVFGFATYKSFPSCLCWVAPPNCKSNWVGLGIVVISDFASRWCEVRLVRVVSLWNWYLWGQQWGL